MRSGFFNSNIEDYDEYGNPIYDRAEEASFFAEFFASFIGNGVYPNPSTGMQVMAKNSMELLIQPGKCFINGYFGLVEEGGEIITIEPADANYSRIDRVVARWDLEIRKIIPFVLKGAPASNPIAPSLTRNSNIYEIALADVAVKANTTVITQANITDRRLDTNLCGIVTGVIEQLDTTTLFNQYQTWFEERKQESADDYQKWFEGFTEPSEEQFTEWFERIKGRLGEDVATNLQAQLDEITPLMAVVSPTEPTGNNRKKIWFQKGKNAINENLLVENTRCGVSCNLENGKIVLSGTATNNYNFHIPVPLKKGLYIFSWYGKHLYPYFTFRDKEGTFISSFESSGESATSNRILTVNKDDDYIIGINVIAGKVYNSNNTSFTVQLEPYTKGMEEAKTEYEKYIYPVICVKNDNGEYEEFTKKTEGSLELTNEDFSLEACTIKQEGKVVTVNLKLLCNGNNISTLTSAGVIRGVDRPGSAMTVAVGVGSTAWQIAGIAYMYVTENGGIYLANTTNTSLKYFHINFSYIAD